MATIPLICHVTTVHAPLDDRIFYRECSALARAGYQVVIIAPADENQNVEGIQILALPQPHRRWDRLSGTGWSAYRLALGLNADLYHLHDPELLPFGELLRLGGKRVIYDAHEDLPDDIMSKDWLPFVLRAPLAAIASIVLPLAGMTCSGIVAATPRIARRFPARKTAFVANYPDPHEGFDAPAIPFAHRSIDALYVGSLSEARGVVEMAQAFADPRMPPSARLAMAGTFGRYGDSSFERRMRSLPGWERVDFLGWQTREQIPPLLRSAKVGLVLLHPQKSFFESLPTKLFEYMLAGLPIVASDFPLWRSIIDAAGCGLLVDPLDPGAIAQAISFLLNHPQQAEAMGRSGQLAAMRNYTWPQQADRLLELYRMVLTGERFMVMEHA